VATLLGAKNGPRYTSTRLWLGGSQTRNKPRRRRGLRCRDYGELHETPLGMGWPAVCNGPISCWPTGAARGQNTSIAHANFQSAVHCFEVSMKRIKSAELVRSFSRYSDIPRYSAAAGTSGGWLSVGAQIRLGLRSWPRPPSPASRVVAAPH